MKYESFFQQGSSEDIIKLIVLHSPSIEECEPKNAIWLKWGIEFLDLFIPIMVWERDNLNKDIGPEYIIEQLKFWNVEKILDRDDVPDNLKKPVIHYIDGLLFFDTDDKIPSDKMRESKANQLGFRTMAYEKTLRSFIDG